METLPTATTTADYLAQLSHFAGDYLRDHPELPLTFSDAVSLLLHWELERPIMKG